MKKVVVVLALAIAGGAALAGEPQEGHGGDPFALEFRATARALVAALRGLPPAELRGIDLGRLSAAVSSARVVSREHVYLKGQEVDAENFWRRRLIVIGRSRWQGLGGNSGARVRLVLHEYLGLSRVDWDGKVSDAFESLLLRHPALIARLGGVVSCGLEGSLAMREADCHNMFEPAPSGWELVLRIGQRVAAYRDTATGLIWSDYDHFFSASSQELAARTCGEVPTSDRVFANIKGNLDELVDFQLPTQADYKAANEDGLSLLSQLVLGNPLVPPLFWTSTPDGGDAISGHLLFDMRDGSFRGGGLGDLGQTGSVRCVGVVR